MCNILINTNNNMLLHGLTLLFKQVFNSFVKENEINIHEFTQDAISDADIVVMPFIAGESTICHQFLQARKANSLMIVFYDGENPHINNELPLCFNNTVFIKRVETIHNIVKLIRQGWEYRDNNIIEPYKRDCFSCKHRTLSEQQIKLVDSFYLGENTSDIAKKLNVKTKTVYAHKRIIMKKYNVSNDFELISLLHHIKNNYFGEHVDNTLSEIQL